MKESLFEVRQTYVAVNRKLCWVILGVLLLSITLATGIVSYIILSKGEKETGRCWPPNHGKKRFYLYSNETDWQGAYMICLRNNSRLASIDNEDDFEAIKQLRVQELDYLAHWTSASDSGSEGNYTWASTGGNLSPSSDMWLAGEPNNFGGKEHCVAIHRHGLASTFGLNDRSCYDNCTFVCEYYE